MTQNATKIYNRAIYYLQRYSATEKHLTTVLQRQLMNKARKGEEIPPQAPQWVAETVQKCVALGLVNDRAFAESRIHSLRRQGRSLSYIKQHLQLKGVAKELIADLLQDTSPEDEATAAQRFAQKRRLGQAQTPEARQKELAKMLRAGFSYDIARTALTVRKDD